jgi:hypothetical protein
MPEIKDNLEHAQQVCQDLSQTFFIPLFFFKRIGWNANGFFGSLDNPMQNPEKKSYSMSSNLHMSGRSISDHTGTFSRFLTKEVTKEPEIKYDWQFMGFCTFWRPASQEAASELQVLLCFDLSTEIQDIVSQAFQQQHLENVEGDPFALLKVVAEVVVERFDYALWTFQPIIRKFEKVGHLSLP